MSGLSHNFFISPEANFHEGDDEITTIIKLSHKQLKDRWNTQEGQFIFTRWKANSFRRDVLNSLVGKFYDHTDIRGINLSKETLTNIDLSYVDLFCANLSESTFERGKLIDSWLSEADLSGTIFKWTEMNNVLIDDVEFDNMTKFIGINLASINFTLASLVQELAIGQQKIEHLERRNPYFAMFLRWACDYGRSFGRFLYCCIGVIVVFSLVHYFIPDTINSGRFLDCLYFSSLTFMRMGNADIYPISGIGRLITIAEVSISYIMLGLLVAIFSRRMIVS